MSEITGIIALIIIVLTTVTLIWELSWRLRIVALALQYLAVFLLVSQMWPISLAAVKLISGWMAGAVIGASQHGNEPDSQPLSLSARLFRLVASSLVFVLVFSLAQQPLEWLNIEQTTSAGGLILIGMGLLLLGLASKPLNVIVGLLTALSGFEVIYAAVVTSVLVTGLLAVITSGVALVGAYWMLSPTVEEAE